MDKNKNDGRSSEIQKETESSQHGNKISKTE